MVEVEESSKLSVYNPVTKEKLYNIDVPVVESLKSVFESAHLAQSKIQDLSIEERIEQIQKIRDYVLNNKQGLLEKISAETGKVELDALTSELFEVVDVIDVLSKTAKGILQDEKVKTPLVLMGKKSKVVYEALGTILVITPWNYPFYQMLVPSLYAFVSGNATIVKPSEHTPLKGVIEEVISKSGFISGAIQVVYGNGETAKALIDLKPQKIHFTGSTATGKKVMEQASKHLIPIELELGGKDAAIVFDDVNIDRTVNGVLWGALTHSGQSCTSIERVYVQEHIYDDFVNSLKETLTKITAVKDESSINGWIKGDMGAMTTEFQITHIEKQIEEAKQKGANIEIGGKRVGGSFFFEPTILTNVDHTMSIMMDETFGPIIPIMKFKTEDEVLQLANDSIYGLSASVWSKDLKRADRVMRKLKVGNVSINNHMLTEANPNLPFGGTKLSGIGRYKGKWGLHAFSNIKAVLEDKQSKLIEAHWYPYTQNKFNLLVTIMDSLFGKTKKWLKVASTGMKLDKVGNKEKL